MSKSTITGSAELSSLLRKRGCVDFFKIFYAPYILVLQGLGTRKEVVIVKWHFSWFDHQACRVF